jgi:uncharacterized protein (TIGR02757 family)
MGNIIYKDQLKEFLDAKVLQYNHSSFITSDPVQVPKLFERKEDIEIAGFLTAIISWGQRSTIIKNALKLMELMDGNPYDFVTQHKEEDLDPFLHFVHRTFNGYDCIYFLKALRELYFKYGGLEEVFNEGYLKEGSIYGGLKNFREVFFKFQDPGKTSKHVSNVVSNSAAKRLNMFLRWMIRKDSNGVDFGIWEKISKADLMVPLDLHSGNTARKLGLLSRKQDDWLAVEELTSALRLFDEADPVKYDYALFGLGVFEKF